MFRRKKTRHPSNRRSSLYRQGRTLRYETMESRIVLSASGFAGNESAPVLDDAVLDSIVPTQGLSPDTEFTFQFSAADVVSDSGEGATSPEDIRFILDPDVEPRLNGATSVGMMLTEEDNGTPNDASDDLWVFSWTPTDAQLRTHRVFLIATDLGGNGGTSGSEAVVPLSDVYAFELTVNDIPSIDLNGSDAEGNNFGPVDFTEGGGPVSIVDTDAFIPFVKDDMVASATIELNNTQADDLLGVSLPNGSPLVVDPSSTASRLVITVGGGNALAGKADFEAALRNLTFENTSDDPGSVTRNISVTINDGVNNSAVATATVNTLGENDRPDLLQNDSIEAGRVGQEYEFVLSATDPENADQLVFKIEAGPEDAVISPNAGQANPKNTIQIDRVGEGYEARINFTPTKEQRDAGSVLLRVSVTDSGGFADVEEYFITIENQVPVAVEDPETPPVASSDDFAVDENNSDDVGNLLANDTDPDEDTLAVDSVSLTDGGSAVADPASFTTAKGALVTIDTNGEVNYNPKGVDGTNTTFESLAAGENDTDAFWYTVNDGKGGVSDAAVKVTVTIFGRNDAPTAVGGDPPVFVIPESAGPTPLDTATLVAAATDIDGDPLSLAGKPANDPPEGTFSFDETSGVLSFDPDETMLDLGPNDEKEVVFEVEITDGSESVPIMGVIKITGVNDAPVAVDDPESPATYTTDQDSSLEVTTRDLGLLGNDTDDGNQANLEVAEVKVNDVAINFDEATEISDGTGRTGLLTVSNDGTFVFNPNDQFNSLPEGGSDTVTFKYTATDGNSMSNEATVTITIDGLNDAPVAISITDFSADEDGEPVSGDFEGEDIDGTPAGDLTYVITRDLALEDEGSVTNNDDGSFTFDPGSDFQDLAEGVTRQVTFDYSAMDQALTSSTDGTVTVTVTGKNDTPIIDLSNESGVPSVLPTGSLRAGTDNIIDLEIDLSSTDENVNDLNMLDLMDFISDAEGHSVGFSFDIDNGTSFQNNQPTLVDGVLSWDATLSDLGQGYIINVSGQDQPAGGMNPRSLDSFDIVIDVVDGNRPEVLSVSPSIDVSLDVSEVTILFNEAMGDSAFVPGNYSLVAVDGGFDSSSAPVTIATPVTGNAGVVLQLTDSTVDIFTLAGGTKLKLTLDSQIADAEGNTLEGDLEFDIDLTTTT